MTILDKLHAIEKAKNIYDIHYCRAGIGIIFYYPDKDKGDNNESWRNALSVKKYYPTFEEMIEAEYQTLTNK